MQIILKFTVKNFIFNFYNEALKKFRDSEKIKIFIINIILLLKITFLE
jgi:hypothetical protein